MEISVGAVLEGTIKSITKFGAFVTLPGGLGTFDEFFDIVSQVKAGELDAKSAILNVGGYFDPLVEMLDRHGPQLYRLAQQLRRVRLPRAAGGVAGSVNR